MAFSASRRRYSELSSSGPPVVRSSSSFSTRASCCRRAISCSCRRSASFSRSGAELLFQVFADRDERRSLLITSNLSFSDWDQIFQGERMTAALLDRLTHHCHIFEMNGESFRFKESMKEKKKPGK